MPCGNIYPIKASQHPCWVCGRLGGNLWCEEWDTPLHQEACLDKFLASEEGRIVIQHDHEVIRNEET